MFEKGLELQIESSPTLEGHYISDPIRIKQVFLNVIGNAVKFRRPGEAPRIDIEFARSNDPATIDQWLISVSDNGIGIADEFVDKVFVIFQRLHGRDAYAGTGIGLALCKKIVEYHGGSIWIDTSYPGGARINFTLPRMEGNSVMNRLTTLDAPPIHRPLEAPVVERTRRSAAFAGLAILGTLLAGCGGTPELDSSEIETVSSAKSVVANAARTGSLTAGGEKKLEALMILCREKPLAESDGSSMRQVLEELAPRLKSADPQFSSKLKTLAVNGCD